MQAYFFTKRKYNVNIVPSIERIKILDLFAISLKRIIQIIDYN